MTADPRVQTPESADDSGEASAPGAGSAPRPAPAADTPPEPTSDEVVPGDPSDPASAPADVEQEPEADVSSGTGALSEAAGLSDAASQAEGAKVVEIDIEALTAKAQMADEYLNLAQRTRAEFENYRKRTAREAAAAQERGAIKLALELLPAIDNLDRALAHAAATESNGDGSLLSGIKHVHSDLIAALKRADIEAYSPEGEPFDPQYHEAVAQQPVEGAEPGTVVEVYQRGYRRGDSVLRPARVIVAG
ncbi:MAG: nucleotide exchange factor GrpE [Solirubrobacteraceae bacterium]